MGNRPRAGSGLWTADRVPRDRGCSRLRFRGSSRWTRSLILPFGDPRPPLQVAGVVLSGSLDRSSCRRAGESARL